MKGVVSWVKRIPVKRFPKAAGMWVKANLKAATPWVLTIVTVAATVSPFPTWTSSRESALLGLTVVGLIWYTYYTYKSTVIGAQGVELLWNEKQAHVDALAFNVCDRLRSIGRSLVTHGGRHVHCSVDDLEHLLRDIRELHMRASALRPEPEGARADRRTGIRQSADWAQRALVTQRARAAAHRQESHESWTVATDAQNQLEAVWQGLLDAGLAPADEANPIPGI